MDFVGIGDLHLSSQNGRGGFSRFVEQSDEYILSEVDRVLDYARENAITAILIYGDICDGVRMSYRAHLQLLAFFRRHKDLDFHVILGNHDKFAKDSNLGHSCEILEKVHLPNVHIYDKPKVVTFEDDARVNFLPYPYTDFKKGMLNVCHLDINGALMDNGKPAKSEVKAKKGCTIVSGHIHSSSNFKSVFYSGTLYQLTFGEDINRKGFHVINMEDDSIEVTYVPFKPKYELRTEIVKDASILESLSSKNVFYRFLLPEDGEEIDPAAYAHLKVVEVKRWGSKAELSDLQTLSIEFQELDLDVSSVLESILQKQYKKEEVEKILKVRSKVLSKT